MMVRTFHHETEMLFLAKKLDGDPRVGRDAWLIVVHFLCGSSNRAIAGAAGRLFAAADRRQLGDGDAA